MAELKGESLERFNRELETKRVAELEEMTRPRKYRSKSVERVIRLYWGVGTVYVKTNHGDVPVQPGEYIITGEGEEYPITKEELEKRYDLVVEDEEVEDKE